MDLDLGEGVAVGDGLVEITFEKKCGRKVRLRINADKQIPLKRIKPDHGDK